jgi:multiple sugar transport system ATP-binding protein
VLFRSDQMMNGVPPQSRDIAMVFQNHALYPHLTAYDNMALGLKLRKLPRAEIQRRVCAAAELLGLQSCLNRLPRALSGGERQRVALGRAWVREPKLFLFDEPLSCLDAPLRAQMLVELRQLQERLGITTLYVTHDQADAMALGDRIAVMHQGRIEQVGSPTDLYARPATLFVAGFMGTPPMNLLTGFLVKHGATWKFRLPSEKAGAGEAMLPLCGISTDWPETFQGQDAVLGIRPEDIRLPDSAAAMEGSPCLDAVVRLLTPLGAETHLRADVQGQSCVVRLPGPYHAQIGSPARLEFRMQRARLYDPKTGLAMAAASDPQLTSAESAEGANRRPVG